MFSQSLPTLSPPPLLHPTSTSSASLTGNTVTHYNHVTSSLPIANTDVCHMESHGGPHGRLMWRATKSLNCKRRLTWRSHALHAMYSHMCGPSRLHACTADRASARDCHILMLWDMTKARASSRTSFQAPKCVSRVLRVFKSCGKIGSPQLGFLYKLYVPLCLWCYIVIGKVKLGTPSVTRCLYRLM